MKTKIFVYTLLLFGLSNLRTSSYAQYSTQQTDSLVTYSLKKFNVAGVAVGIVKDGKIVYTKGYGVQSVKTNTPVNEHTNFAIASNSKAFTATALALLVEEGKLQWTDKVKEHIPEFKMYNAYVTENFNIQDLLCHRSGLGLGIGDLMLFPDGGNFTINDILNSFQYFKPVSAFRTKFDYDNLLYIVAGEVIKRVSGMTYEDFVATRIFKPLNMDNTFPDLKSVIKQQNLATPHASVKKELIPLNQFEDMINSAAGGIYSNVDDMCQWMLMHLNKGTYGSELKNKLFSEKSQREMWKIHTVLDASLNPRYNSHFAGYGLGWNLSDVKGNLMVSHTGGVPGMLTKVTMIPDINLGVVVLTNTGDDGAAVFSAVSQAIIDSYLGLDNFGWVDKYAHYFEANTANADSITEQVWLTVEKANVKSINEDDFIGTYEDAWFGKMEVFRKDKQLWIKSLRSPKLIGQMFFYKANTFVIKWDYQNMNADAFAMFCLDENGKAQGLKMKGISPNIDFSFDFQDLDLKRVE